MKTCLTCRYGDHQGAWDANGFCMWEPTPRADSLTRVVRRRMPAKHRGCPCYEAKPVIETETPPLLRAMGCN